MIARSTPWCYTVRTPFAWLPTKIRGGCVWLRFYAERVGVRLQINSYGQHRVLETHVKRQTGFLHVRTRWQLVLAVLRAR